MTWTDIVNNNPKATEACGKWFEVHRGMFFHDGDWTTFMSDGRYMHLRDLYGFFDEQALFITTSFDGVSWDFNIYNPDGIDVNAFMHGNRSEAEAAAFTKAFELLEEKLNLR
jgi:hypothetical protein